MTCQIFEPIIQDVINLVNEQIGMLKDRVAALLLTGRFSQNQYLRQRINTSIPTDIPPPTPEP